MVAQFWEYTKTSLLYSTVKGGILWYVNYMSVKKRKQERAHWNFIRNVQLNFFGVWLVGLSHVILSSEEILTHMKKHLYRTTALEKASLKISITKSTLSFTWMGKTRPNVKSLSQTVLGTGL